MGISIFLACVGNAGNGFIDTIIRKAVLPGWSISILITIVPLLVVGLNGSFVCKLNYLQLVGMMVEIATTDPPALAYANSLTDSVCICGELCHRIPTHDVP